MQTIFLVALYKHEVEKTLKGKKTVIFLCLLFFFSRLNFINIVLSVARIAFYFGRLIFQDGASSLE